MSKQNSNDVLVVRNIEQAAAWLELDGQISDGHWENSSPQDHWVPWCNARVVVAQDGQQVGRNFYARRDTYNFTNVDLLRVVGKRMLGIIRIARKFGIDVASDFEHDVDLDGRIELPTYTGETWDQKRAKINAIGLDALNAACDDESYTFDAMKWDLVELKKIIKTKIDAVVVRTNIDGIVKEELRYGVLAERLRIEAESAKELRIKQGTEQYGKMFVDASEAERQLLDVTGSTAQDAIERMKINHRVTQAEKGCQLIKSARQLRDRMNDLVNSLMDAGTYALPNSLGEVQGKGADVDRLCAEFALLRSLSGGSR